MQLSYAVQNTLRSIGTRVSSHIVKRFGMRNGLQPDHLTIKLAGSDEGRTFSTGQVVWTTGWGKMTPWTNQVPDTLRKAKLVVQSDRLCGLDSSFSYPRNTMLCLGSAEGHSSACSGDSGGPLVAWTTGGYRLVGATSGGDRFCRGYVPSFFAKVSGDRVRSWIVKTAGKMTDYGVVGSGGTASPDGNSISKWSEGR